MSAKRQSTWRGALQVIDGQDGQTEEPGRDGEDMPLKDQIREDLETRGVAAELSEALSAQLLGKAAELDPDNYACFLDGVALVCGAQDEADEDLNQNASEVREIERMMGAFAGELSKLDETLEVLSAYVRRMRTGSSARNGRILH